MVAENSARLGRTLNREKGKLFRTNTFDNTLITVQGEALEDMDSFTYLDSILTTREERMQMSEPLSVKHEQPSNS
ncbi:hypothetical protein DPMN_051903 [Dreissena polymorpha]|uniref:Uncharacterized protein n=1 Tax=Dreissena polymorpha TaxID=45954 RepID=A0A9D4CIP5_DREPO|nr:hypothetical protein DPMN_051903 [Dreissena polymorpha]